MWLGTTKREKVNKCSKMFTIYKLGSRLSQKGKIAPNLGFVATYVSLRMLYILPCIFFFFFNTLKM